MADKYAEMAKLILDLKKEFAMLVSLTCWGVYFFPPTEGEWVSYMPIPAFFFFGVWLIKQKYKWEERKECRDKQLRREKECRDEQVKREKETELTKEEREYLLRFQSQKSPKEEKDYFNGVLTKKGYLHYGMITQEGGWGHALTGRGQEIVYKANK